MKKKILLAFFVCLVCLFFSCDVSHDFFEGYYVGDAGDTEGKTSFTISLGENETKTYKLSGCGSKSSFYVAIAMDSTEDEFFLTIAENKSFKKIIASYDPSSPKIIEFDNTAYIKVENLTGKSRETSLHVAWFSKIGHDGGENVSPALEEYSD